MFDDTKGALKCRKSKNRQYNDQQKNDKRTINDLLNITQKTNDRDTRTPLKLSTTNSDIHIEIHEPH
jgi:hypothetical protein